MKTFFTAFFFFFFRFLQCKCKRYTIYPKSLQSILPVVFLNIYIAMSTDGHDFFNNKIRYLNKTCYWNDPVLLFRNSRDTKIDEVILCYIRLLQILVQGFVHSLLPSKCKKIRGHRNNYWFINIEIFFQKLAKSIGYYSEYIVELCRIMYG